MVVNVDGVCRLVGKNAWIPSEFRLVIRRDQAGENGRKAWFLVPQAKIEGRPVTFKRKGNEKNARNLQASYIYHEAITQEKLQEILSCKYNLNITVLL